MRFNIYARLYVRQKLAKNLEENKLLDLTEKPIRTSKMKFDNEIW